MEWIRRSDKARLCLFPRHIYQQSMVLRQCRFCFSTHGSRQKLGDQRRGEREAKDKQQTCMGASRERKCIFAHAHPSLLYFTRIMGKYECGSCGASSTRSGRQRLNANGGVGGNLDSEYALRAEVMVAIA